MSSGTYPLICLSIQSIHQWLVHLWNAWLLMFLGPFHRVKIGTSTSRLQQIILPSGWRPTLGMLHYMRKVWITKSVNCQQYYILIISYSMYINCLPNTMHSLLLQDMLHTCVHVYRLSRWMSK